MPNFIASGTVNVTAGQTLVTFEDVLLTEARAGDTLELYGANKGRYTLASIGVDLVSAQFTVPFDGVTQTDAPYTIRYDSLQRVPPLELADQLRRMRDQIRIFERTAPLYRVQSIGSNTPPGAPVDGDMYIVGTAPTGAWVGQAGNFAQWTGSSWLFTTVEPGWMGYSVANGNVFFRSTSVWIPYVGPSSFIQALMDDANDAAARATLGGTAFQALGTLTGAAGAFARFTGPDGDDAVMQAIVGAVSQSGGVPTGAIVEQGSNGNGEYVRFADGTQICWRRHLRAPGVMAGGAFVSLGAYTFPAAFVAPPVVAAMYDGGWSVYIMASVQGVTAAGLGGAYFTNVGSASRDTTGTNPTFHYIAVGRWF